MKTWKRKRQLQVRRRLLCAAIILTISGKYAIDKYNISDEEYATEFVEELKDKIENDKNLNSFEKSLLSNEKLLYDVCLSYRHSYMKFVIPSRIKYLDIKPFTKEEIENAKLKDSLGYFKPIEGTILHIRNYQEDKEDPYNYLEVISHEYAHLFQSLNIYSYLDETAAEIISNEYYSTENDSYVEECKRTKVLMEIIGSKAIWDCTIKGTAKDLERSINDALSKEDAQTLLDALTNSPYYLSKEERKEINKIIDELLAKMYFNIYNEDIKENKIIMEIYNGNLAKRHYFNTERRNNPEAFNTYVVTSEEAYEQGLIEKRYCEKVIIGNNEVMEYLSEEEAKYKFYLGENIYYTVESAKENIELLYYEDEIAILEEQSLDNSLQLTYTN